MNEILMMKVHREGPTSIMALSDIGLLGSSLIEGDLTFKVTNSFYEGDIVTEELVLRTIHTVNSINAIGERSVGLLIEAGYASKDLVRTFQDIPHIQVYIV